MKSNESVGDLATRMNLVEGEYGLNTYNTPDVVEELLYIDETITSSSENTEKRVFITGSTAGLGQLTAKYLLSRGYQVVVHARNEERAEDIRRDLPEIEAVVIGELSDLNQTRQLADDVNVLGPFDVIIHNAAVYGATSEETVKVNILSPYLLTALIDKPRKLIYLTSDLHLGGELKKEELQSDNPQITYSDTKLQTLTLAMAVARRWPDVQVNGVAPGWVPTRMGFANGNTTTPDELRDGYMTQVWLTEGKEEESQVTGEFFFHQEPETDFNPIIRDEQSQEKLIEALENVTDVSFPD